MSKKSSLSKISKLAPAFLLLLLLLILARSYEHGTIVMGLDNASNYFYPMEIFKRIREGEAFIYSGLIFTAPIFQLIRSIGVSPSMLSWLYLSYNLISGVFGVYYLAKCVDKSRSNITATLAALTVLGSLLSVWIFNQPNFLFMAAYGSVPWIIYYLVTLSNEKKWYAVAHYHIVSLFLLTTSLNPVAFLLYIFQIAVLAYVLRSNTEASQSRALKPILLWCVGVVLILIIAIQSLLFINSGKLVTTEFAEYTRSLRSNPIVLQITDDLRESESNRNTFINSARFAGGWVDLHLPDGERVFEYLSYYDNWIVQMLGLVPFLVIVTQSTKARESKLKALSILSLFGILLTTKYAMSFYGYFDTLSNALRWPSSKFWPIVILPLSIAYAVLVMKSVDGVKKHLFKSIVLLIVTATALIYTIPLLIYGLPSSTVKVDFPEEILQLNEISEESSILVLPEPQKLYFREYEWGYYGDDFLTYITQAEVIDSSNLYYRSGYYEESLETLTYCSTVDIDYLLIWGSGTREFIDECEYQIVHETASYTLYEIE